MVKQILDYIRVPLYFLVTIIGCLLYQNWQQEHSSIAQSTSNATSAPLTIPKNTAPVIISDTVLKTPPPSSIAPTKLVVKTDTLVVTIDRVGGNITDVKLLKYREEANSPAPYVLLNNNAASKYIAQSGLINETLGPDSTAKQALYNTANEEYTLNNSENSLTVPLTWTNSAGITVTKIFKFTRGSYVVNLDYVISNQSGINYEANQFLQLGRINNPPQSQQGLMSLATYFGAAISSPDKKFQKIPFKDIEKQNFDKTITGGWGAMIQHYFVSAWIPDTSYKMQYFTRLGTDGLYKLGMIGPAITVAPGQTQTLSAKFYAGPAIADDLEKAAPDLKLTIDYGWFWFISAIIFWMMQKIYNFIGNWGWSIVLVTVVIKLVFYRLSAKSYTSMSSLKKLQPKLNQLKERYADDKQKFTQATIELYKKEKVNPMGGCLPILIQIPVFIGLYWVLIESVQLRQAPWILWIHDLSIKDPFYVLPVLMGLSMFLQQRLNPPSPDPLQAKVLMFMPVIFTVLFMNFPAGLMLYWFVNNTLSFLQQWYIMRSMENGKTKSLVK
jgi:YidC/Oxa1 family membrane protein insertase